MIVMGASYVPLAHKLPNLVAAALIPTSLLGGGEMNRKYIKTVSVLLLFVMIFSILPVEVLAYYANRSEGGLTIVDKDGNQVSSMLLGKASLTGPSPSPTVKSLLTRGANLRGSLSIVSAGPRDGPPRASFTSRRTPD